MKKLFKVREAIKTPGKSFDDLSLAEVASMIEADSALSPGGNAEFDSAALDIFLHNIELRREDLQKIRACILERIYTSDNGTVDVSFLREFAQSLRDGRWDAGYSE